VWSVASWAWSGPWQGWSARGAAAPAGLAERDPVAYLGVLYRWVSDEDGRFAFEENLMATLDVVLPAITLARRDRDANGDRR
jgi:hypothetical protein